MKREHKYEALCVDGSVISFDQILALRGRIVRHGSWHYLQIPGEEERAVVVRPTLREALRIMGDYARERKRKAKAEFVTQRQVAAYVAGIEHATGKPPKIVRDVTTTGELPFMDNLRGMDGEPEPYLAC